MQDVFRSFTSLSIYHIGIDTINQYLCIRNPLPGEDKVLEGGRAVEGRPLPVHEEAAEEERLCRAGRELGLVVEVLALHDAVRGQLVEVGGAAVAPGAHAVRRDELAADPPLAAPAVHAQQAGEVAGVVDGPVAGGGWRIQYVF